MARWKRIFNVTNIPLIVATVASLSVGLLDVYGKFDQQSVPTVILFSMSALTIGLLVDRTAYFERIENAIASARPNSESHGVFATYLGRNELPTYRELVTHCREQIMVMSIDLGETATRYMDYLAEAAATRRRVQLMAFDPDSSEISLVAKLRGMSDVDLRSHIRTSLNNIEQHKTRLPEWQRDYIQVRVFDWTPTWGGIAIDPGLPTGRILFDVFQYRVGKALWPEIELRGTEGDGALYYHYARTYNQAWQDATPWPKTASTTPLPAAEAAQRGQASDQTHGHAQKG
ncbi:hypothetical protein GCM10023322_82000 [Rugosimonospora acidiphila]|uniref:Uncharacterized protein n=1 Tax=Rugosimonospora acidiphila TaxID=556531 RepID=A0ABP9SVT9_9ACTN